MCRHLMPRFDLPLGQALHGLGRFAVVHPTAAVAMVLVPLCAAILFVICRDGPGPAVVRRLRPGPARPLSRFDDDRLGTARSG